MNWFKRLFTRKHFTVVQLEGEVAWLETELHRARGRSDELKHELRKVQREFDAYVSMTVEPGVREMSNDYFGRAN